FACSLEIRSIADVCSHLSPLHNTYERYAHSLQGYMEAPGGLLLLMIATPYHTSPMFPFDQQKFHLHGQAERINKRRLVHLINRRNQCHAMYIYRPFLYRTESGWYLFPG